MSSDLWDRFVDLLIRYRLPLLILAAVLTGLSFDPASRVSFDQSLESLYSKDNPHLADYVESESLFGGDEFVFLAYTDPELLQEAGQKRLQQLTEQVAAVPGVVADSVQSLSTQLEITSRRPFQSRRQQLLDFSRGALLGEDNQTTAVAVRLIEATKAPQPRANTIAELRHIAATQPLPTYVVGEPVLVLDMFRYAQEDGQFMGWAASALLVVVILVFLHDLRSVILPFVIVQATILWTRAILWASHIQLTMVSSILGSLVTIIGVSTVVYLSLYYHDLREECDRETAFRRVLSIIGGDLAWVCLATTAGFAAHLSSHLHPVRSFGLTMVVGSLLVLVAMMLIVPGGMLIGGPRGEPPPVPRGSKQVGASLQHLTAWVLRNPFGIALATVVLVGTAVGGLFRLHLETDFTKNFVSSTPVVKSLGFMEDHLGGAGIWEVNFPAPTDLEDEFLDKVRRLAVKLRELKHGNKPALTKVIALTDGLDLLPTLPLFVRDNNDKARWLDGLVPGFTTGLFNSERGRMRLVLRASERQSAEDRNGLIDDVTRTALTEFPEAKVTGPFVLLTHLVESLLEDQWTGLLVGAAGLITMMSLAYRSLWMGLVSLVPNVLPIMLLLGGMGWAGIPINIGTAMISSDVMGLTIHDSIFYLSAYRRARRSGLDFHGSLQQVQSEVRRPLIYSNLALILGFLVLTMSHFVPLIYFGALVSIAIAGGLVVNLLLIPLLLQLGEYLFVGRQDSPVAPRGEKPNG